MDTITHYSSYTKPLLRRVDQGKWSIFNDEDVLALLREVQIGYISCKRAVEIIKNSS